MPLSPCFKIAMIWLSEKRDSFMQNLPAFSLRKILLLTNLVFRGGLPGNFHRLGMYNLGELSKLLAQRDNWDAEKQARHQEILSKLQVVSKNYGIAIPNHWL